MISFIFACFICHYLPWYTLLPPIADYCRWCWCFILRALFRHFAADDVATMMRYCRCAGVSATLDAYLRCFRHAFRRFSQRLMILLMMPCHAWLMPPRVAARYDADAFSPPLMFSLLIAISSRFLAWCCRFAILRPLLCLPPLIEFRFATPACFTPYACFHFMLRWCRFICFFFARLMMLCHLLRHCWWWCHDAACRDAIFSLLMMIRYAMLLDMLLTYYADNTHDADADYRCRWCWCRYFMPPLFLLIADCRFWY